MSTFIDVMQSSFKRYVNCYLELCDQKRMENVRKCMVYISKKITNVNMNMKI